MSKPLVPILTPGGENGSKKALQVNGGCGGEAEAAKHGKIWPGEYATQIALRQWEESVAI